MQRLVRRVPGVPSEVHYADHLLVVPCLRISGAILSLICVYVAVLNEGHMISPPYISFMPFGHYVHAVVGDILRRRQASG